MVISPSDSSRRKHMMSKYIPGNQKHLTLENRIYIENELNKGASFKDIARFLCKDPTIISKEVRLIVSQIGSTKGLSIKPITSVFTATTVRRLMPVERLSCAESNTHRNQTCRDFEKERCVRLDRAPYVCNGCTKKINHCTIAHKYNYNARSADRKYREKLRGSRVGINMTKRELRKKDQIVSPLIEQGQSPYHILTNHPELDMSVHTLYSYLDQGLFTARNIDLKRKVHFKPRKCHKTQITDRVAFTNRSYRDFCSLAPTGYVQMDTLHSYRESKKTLLTMFSPKKKTLPCFSDKPLHERRCPSCF